MSTALEVTIILGLIVITIALVALLIQLRQTARGLDAFLNASRKDLAQIAEDVHASRLRMDRLAISLQVSLDEFSAFASLVGLLGSTVKDFHTRFHETIESASRNLGGIIGGITAVSSFFKRNTAPSKPEQEC